MSVMCGCVPSYAGLLFHHRKCMQSYSCTAAPMIHADAKALTDASVWKYQIDMLTLHEMCIDCTCGQHDYFPKC